MPSISSTDGGYHYYQRSINDLEDEVQEDAAKTRKRQENEIADLEDNYKREIAKRDREMEHTIQDIRENSAQSLARDHENSKEELAHLKGQVYDRQGRVRSQEADGLRSQLRDEYKAEEIRHQKAQEDLDDTEAAYQRKIDDLQADHQTELEKVVRESRDNTRDRTEESHEQEKDAFERYKDAQEQKYDRLNRERMQEMKANRRLTEQQVNDSRRDFQHRLNGFQEKDSSRLEQRERAMQKEKEQLVHDLNLSHKDQLDTLRSQINQLNDQGRLHAKDAGKAVQDAIRDYEVENRTRDQNMVEGHQRELENMKLGQEEAERHWVHAHDQALREKDQFFGNMIRQQNLEGHLNQKDLENVFEKNLAQRDLRNKLDKEQARQSLEHTIARSNEARENALHNQAQAFEDAMRSQHLSEEDQISTLQRELKAKTNPSDTSQITPAAESAVRNSIIREYEKTMAADEDRNKRAIEQLHRDYATQLQNTALDAVTDKTRMEQEHAAATQAERTQFLDHINDTELLKNLALRNKEVEGERYADNLARNYAALMERQRREYEDILTAARGDSQYKLQVARQESEFQYKNAQRSFAERENELIREYDKKAADQKNVYESQIDELKANSQKALRDTERKSRQSYDEQARSYEQRIAQLENQIQERERYLTENFDREVENLKRSYADQLKKKG